MLKETNTSALEGTSSEGAFRRSSSIYRKIGWGAEQLQQCRQAVAADETGTLAELVKKAARRKDPDCEPLARAIAKYYKKGRSWRDWLWAAGEMVEEHRSLLGPV